MLGKVPHGGHREAGGPVLMTMRWDLCATPQMTWDDTSTTALCDELAVKGFGDFTVGTTALWLP